MLVLFHHLPKEENMAPKVSIIVPVYKTEPFLRQCLDSLIQQTLTDIEIVAVDDGSPDKAPEILDEYAKKDKRIRVIHQENKGLGAAYNAGLRVVQGEYVGFIDSDDWVEKNMFADLYALAQKHKADVVKSAGYIIEQDDRTEPSFKIPTNKCNQLVTNPLNLPEFVGTHVCQWTAIYKRGFLEYYAIRAPERKTKDFTPDIGFVYQVWITARSIFVTPKLYVHYRQHSGAATHQGSKMSFRLLMAHQETARIMAKMPQTTPAHWQVKSRVEYEHFLYDLNNRCKDNRRKFIRAISEVFRDRIKEKRVTPKFLQLNPDYKMIANHPFLYWLNDCTKWWSEAHAFDKPDYFWRLFGLYKRVETKSSVRTYICGIPVRKTPNYTAQLFLLNNKLDRLHFEIQALRDQKKRSGKAVAKKA